jgi:hypothetical protein
VEIIFIRDATNIGHRHYFSGLSCKEIEMEIAKKTNNLPKANSSAGHSRHDSRCNPQL